MLGKFCLYLQRPGLLKCLTCLQRSSHSSTCGVVERDHPLVYGEFLHGTMSNVQRSLNVLVSLLLDEFEKQKQAPSSYISKADLMQTTSTVLLQLTAATGFTLCLYWYYFFNISSND